MNKKILILILSSNRYPSPINEYFQKKTWIKGISSPNVEIIFYKSAAIDKYRKNKLYINQKDRTVKGIADRTLLAFQWSLKNKNFDYIFRINSSSYINIKKLITYVEKMGSENIYSGKILDYFGEKYISGAGILLSKDIVELIVSKRTNLDNNYLDDVAIGKLLRKSNIPITKGNFQYFTKNIYRENIKSSEYQFRCNMYYFGFPRFLEGFFMQKIHNYLDGKADSIIHIFPRTVIDLLRILNLNYLILRYIKRSNKVFKG